MLTRIAESSWSWISSLFSEEYRKVGDSLCDGTVPNAYVHKILCNKVSAATSKLKLRYDFILDPTRNRHQMAMRRLNLDLPKQPRNREVKACLSCRNGKTKCDRGKPQCQKCMANNRKCVYVSKLEDDVRSHLSLPNRSVRTTAGPIPQEKGSLRNPSIPSPGLAKIPDQQDTIWPDQSGLLTADDDAKQRYYESSSWIAAVRNLEGSPESLSPLLSDMSSPGSLSSLGNHSQNSLETPIGEIYEFVNLPEVNRLICWYSEYVQFWHPIANGSSVVAALQCLRAHKPCPTGSSALLAAICYSASSSLHASAEMESSSFEPSAWKELAQQFLSTAQYPQRPCLNTIRAAFLLAAPSMAEWYIDPDPAPISVLVRAAQSVGLHRDPASFGFSSQEVESRRALWWCIQNLDVSYSFAHALPPLIHSSSYDVKLVSGKGKLETRLLETQARSNLLFTRIAEEVYSVRKPTQESFRRLNEDVKNAYDYTMEQVRRFQSENPTDMERFIMLCQRLTCYRLSFILHQPYLRSSRWPRDSRKLALSSSKSYIKEFVDGLDDPAFAPYQWLLNHYNVYHASAIVLQDLIQYPKSAESAELFEVIDPTMQRFSQDVFRPCPPCKKLCLLLEKACELNKHTTMATNVDTRIFDAMIDDWDPIFPYCQWDETSPNGLLDCVRPSDITL